MKIGLVGAGYWGQKYARVIGETPGMELSAVCDLDERKRADFGNKFYRSFREFKDADFDAAIVVSPAEYHYYQACELLEAGKHVMVEKPFAVNESLHDGMIKAAKMNGVVVFPAHIYWHNDYVDHLVDFVSKMRVRYIQSFRQALGPVRNCGVLYDLVPHDLSILQRIGLELPDTVQCSGAKVENVSHKDGFVSCALNYDTQKVLASINATWLYPTKLRQMTIAGDKIVMFDDMSTTTPIKIYSQTTPSEASWTSQSQTDIAEPFIEHTREPLKNMFNAFIAACHGDTEMLGTYQHWALNITRILEHLDESMGLGGDVVRVR